MNLLSIGFLAFLGTTVVVYWLVSARWRAAVLLAASMVFYAAWSPGLLALLLAAIYVNHGIFRLIRASSVPGRWLLVGVVVQCGLLGTFKYLGFFLASLESSLALAGVATDLGTVALLAPLGLSYFCLKAIALLVDTRRGQMDTVLTLHEHALYLLFFPSLTAGPIDRPRAFLDQIAPAFLPDRRTALARGGDLLVIGFLKKAVIANGLAPGVDSAFATDFVSTGAALLAALTYAFYIYADFSGYTDIARGAAACFGIDLAVNFRRPYAARSTSEFWQRWHISLSTWLRDYLFLPLGGAFRSRRRAYLNLLITMMLAGLWHGAAWTYLLWGCYIGVLLVGHRALQPALKRLRRGLRLRGGLRQAVEVSATFFLITVGWLLFRATSLGQIGSALRGGLGGIEVRHFLVHTAPYVLAVMLLDLLIKDDEPTLARVHQLPWWGRPIVFTAIGYAILVLGTETQSFIYAQF